MLTGKSLELVRRGHHTWYGTNIPENVGARKGGAGLGRKKAVEEHDLVFARELAAAMKRAGIRPSDLARLFPAHKATVSRWRKGVPPNDPVRRARLAELLQTSEASLYAGVGAPLPSAPAGVRENVRRPDLARLDQLTEGDLAAQPPEVVLKWGTMALLHAISEPAGMSLQRAAWWVEQVHAAGRRSAAVRGGRKHG